MAGSKRDLYGGAVHLFLLQALSPRNRIQLFTQSTCPIQLLVMQFLCTSCWYKGSLQGTSPTGVAMETLSTGGYQFTGTVANNLKPGKLNWWQTLWIISYFGNVYILCLEMIDVYADSSSMVASSDCVTGRTSWRGQVSGTTIQASCREWINQDCHCVRHLTANDWVVLLNWCSYHPRVVGWVSVVEIVVKSVIIGPLLHQHKICKNALTISRL